jgi:hypothetical protein
VSNLFGDGVEKGATLSPCGLYRYQLWRVWDETRPRLLFIMLNPSTADAEVDDPTIKKCIKYARAWGYGGLEVVNLYALRSTDPNALKGHPNPRGDENDRYIFESACRAGCIVAAWGQHKAIGARGRYIKRLLAQQGFDLYCLRTTKNGQPWHPLYVPDAQTPVGFHMTERASAGRGEVVRNVSVCYGSA